MGGMGAQGSRRMEGLERGLGGGEVAELWDRYVRGLRAGEEGSKLETGLGVQAETLKGVVLRGVVLGGVERLGGQD